MKRTLLLVVFAVVVGALLYANGLRIWNERQGPAPLTGGNILPPPSSDFPDALKDYPTRKAVEQLEPAVVNIDTVGRPQAVGIPDWSGIRTQWVQPQGAGSGVIIRPDGFIVTNYHVIQDAQNIDVTLSSGERVPGEIWGVDPMYDLAVIKINRKGLKFARLANSDQIRVGDPVIAVGNALGLGTTVTSGIISARERKVEGPAQNKSLESAIQTDAAINRGNSGGALALLTGEIVGINTAIFSTEQGGGSIGIGFAIPSNIVRREAEELIQHRKVTRPPKPWLGVWYVQMTPALANAARDELSFDYPDPDAGVLVRRVENGSPADRAGVRNFDQILRLDGKELKNEGDFAEIVQTKKPGDSIKIRVYRPTDGRERELTAELAAVPEQLQQPQQPPARTGPRLPF